MHFPDAAFIVIPVLLVAMLVWATAAAWRRSGATRAAAIRMSILVGVGAAAWMAITWGLAASEVFRRWDRNPPPFGLLDGAILLLGAGMAFSGLGRRLAEFTPLWALVAVQAFRLPLELAMHATYERGIMPGVMSYSGRNFDIVTGATAVVVAAMVAAGWGGRGLVAAWNMMGLGLLINVVVVAVMATPRFRYFGSAELNVWVMDPPYVWLPAVMVLAALTGHLVIFRALKRPLPLVTAL